MSSAGYRFVPISPTVVAPPVRFADIDHAKPLAGGSVSGELEVTWTADTELCVGETRPEAGDLVTPLLIGGRYCLPGPSQRGMVRSVLEIATFSHLGRINSWRHTGIRTYDHDPMPEAHKHRPQDIRAGWLTFVNGSWRLRRAWFGGSDQTGFRRLRISNLIAHANLGISAQQWNELSAAQKYDRINAIAPFEHHQMVAETITDPGTRSQVRIARFPTDVERRRPDLMEGHIVCMGSGERRSYEAFVAPPHPRDSWTITRELMDAFHRLHATPGCTFEDCTPLDNPLKPWRYWLCRMGYYERLHFKKPRGKDDPTNEPIDQGIPVFFVRDPTQPGFFFGLSRVLRLPWRHSVGDVAQNIYAAGNAPGPYVVPKLGDEAAGGWDFARALFGEVEEAGTDVRRAGRAAVAEGATRATAALAGRVAFGFAWAPVATTSTRNVSGVLGTPRESYYPFYLRRKDAAAGEPDGATYDDDSAIPAGRKRYVVREQVVALPQVALDAQGKPKNEDIATTFAVLPRDTTFVGRIRFHNLHPVELGGLAWALTFGEPDTTTPRYRHQIGRARAHGFGSLRAAVRLVTLTAHDQPAVEKNCANGALDRLATYVERFRAYMAGKLGSPHEERHEIKALLKAADPRVGAQAAGAGQLGTLPLEAGAPGQTTYPNLKRAFDEARTADGGSIARNRLPDLPD